MHRVVIEFPYVDCVLVSVDTGFLVEVIRFGLSGYLLLMVLLSSALCFDRCNTVLRNPNLSDCVLVILLMVIIDVLDENINTLYKIWNTSGQIKLKKTVNFSVDVFSRLVSK